MLRHEVTATDEGALLRVRDGRLRLGDVDVLIGIDVSFRAGEIVALVGPNGAGKTSLLRVLAGEVPLTSGTRAPRPGPATALMGDTPFLYDVLTPAEHVEFVARFCGREVHVDAVLAEFDLARLRRTFARDLSLGERQRLALALVQVSDPAVVLMDEPFNGMDPSTSLLLTMYLQRLANDGRAVVVATHHVGDLQPVANRVLVLDAGAVVLDRSLAHGEGIEAAVRPHTRVRA